MSIFPKWLDFSKLFHPNLPTFLHELIHQIRDNRNSVKMMILMIMKMMILTDLREGEELRWDEIASFGSFNWFYPPDDGDDDHRDHDSEDDDFVSLFLDLSIDITILTWCHNWAGRHWTQHTQGLIDSNLCLVSINSLGGQPSKVNQAKAQQLIPKYSKWYQTRY